MARRIVHFCGECSHFGYEDVYGIGSCIKKRDMGSFDVMRYCGEESCDDFEEEIDVRE